MKKVKAEAEERKAFVLHAMQHFNKKGQYYRHVVDGEKLGVLILDWASARWIHYWCKLEKI